MVRSAIWYAAGTVWFRKVTPCGFSVHCTLYCRIHWVDFMFVLSGKWCRTWYISMSACLMLSNRYPKSVCRVMWNNGWGEIKIILFHSILFYNSIHSILFYMYSILFYSILFYSIPLHSILFCSILFFSILMTPNQA